MKVVLTLNQFDKKEKHAKKESLSSREIFLNFHSLKKDWKIQKKISWNHEMIWRAQKSFLYPNISLSFSSILSMFIFFFLFVYYVLLTLFCFVLYLFLDITYFDIRLLPRDSDGTIIFPQIPKSRGIFVLFFVWFNTKGFVSYLSDFMNIIFYRLIPIFCFAMIEKKNIWTTIGLKLGGHSLCLLNNWDMKAFKIYWLHIIRPTYYIGICA